MIFDFLKKDKEITEKKKIIEIMIISLNIPSDQKELFLDAISVLTNKWLEKLYISLLNFTHKLEDEELNNIWNTNFYQVAWMRKKEANEKQKELNSFSFLISNL